MRCITIKRGNDGFGSQLFSIISGLAYCLKYNIQYSHSQIENIKLIDKNEFQNDELYKANLFINNFINTLGVDSKRSDCEVYPFLHDYIHSNGVDNFFTDDFIKIMNNSHFSKKPKIYENEKFNIAIHIRRGNDIPTSHNIHFSNFQENYNQRWIDSTVYDDLIDRLNKKIPNCVIHIFSWNDPKLNVSLPNIEYHIVDNGELFMEDFSALIHSDLLVVGSSTFSISAGFFNKNKVICDPSLCKLPNTPIPSLWFRNYNNIINS